MTLAICARTIQGTNGQVLNGAEVSVRVGPDAGGALADLFADRAGTTPLANPVTTDSFGGLEFYAEPGTYLLQPSGASPDADQIVDLTVDLSDRAINSGTGLTGGGNLSANRTLALTGQALALHQFTGSGLLVRTGSASYAARTLTGGDGVNVSNGNGVSGNPSVAVDSTVTRTSRQINSGDGLTGGGDLSSNRTLSVDSSVMRGADNLSDIGNAGTARNNLNLGTAATADVTTSDTDTTSGRLTKVGDGGLLGSTSSIDDWDAFDKSQPSNMLRNTSSSTSNNPWDTWMALVALRRDASRVGFLGLRTFGVPNAQIGYYDGEITQVETLYHTGNLVGTVSQSGGDPTGAVIERGSNSNGEYVRFADGTQICCHSPASVDLTDTGNQRYDFPAEFVSSDIACSASILVDGLFTSDADNRAISTAAVGVGHTAGDRQNWIFRVLDPGNSTDTTRLSLMAVGRWF